MKNLQIRILVSDKNLKYKDIADEMNISRQWLSRLMRNTLTPDNETRIINAINSLCERRTMPEEKISRRDELKAMTKGELCNLVLQLEKEAELNYEHT